MKSLKKYRIFDTNGNILSENKEVMAESPIKAVRLFYRNIKRALHELYKILARMGWNHKRRRERPHDNL